MANLTKDLTRLGDSEIGTESSSIEHGVRIPVFDQRGELPLLPFGNPIGFVPASRGGIYIESTARLNVRFCLNVQVDPPKGSPTKEPASL